MDRRGVSILEVMFAILVTVVGLLGAVAVFPAASSMARKGRIADVSSSAGRSATHDFDVRGMRRPDRWLAYSSATWDFPPAPPVQTGFVSVNPVPVIVPNPTPPPATITVMSPGIRYPTGTAFCIDPRGVAGAAQAQYDTDPKTAVPYANEMASLFPAVARQTIAGSLDPRMMRVSLVSGLKDGLGNLIYNPAPAGLNPNQLEAAANSMRLLADAAFTFDDDLSIERSVKDRSLPANQIYDYLGGSGPNAKRLADGHFSWLATLVPKVALAPTISGQRVIMVPTPTDEYVLSIVVFHDRLLPFDKKTGHNLAAERLVQGVFQGDGSTGGEIQLLANQPDDLKLRTNDWVLVSGVYAYREYDPTNGNTIGDRLTNVPAFQWYRVSSADKDAEPSGASPPIQIYASLVGQDWSPSVVNPVRGPGAVGSAQVTIVEGVVAVYEKTVRLEYGSSL